MGREWRLGWRAPTEPSPISWARLGSPAKRDASPAHRETTLRGGKEQNNCQSNVLIEYPPTVMPAYHL
jgi:hypothetical protein